MVRNPKFLIILASYNGEKYINQQIDSILKQVEVELDIMVFDDQSSDRTIDIVKDFFNAYKNIELIINSVSSGSAAKNFCNSIKQISENTFKKYDFIALSDQDDIWLPYKLHHACEELLNNNAGLYASNLILWEEKTNKKSLLKKDYPQSKFDFLFEGGSAGCTYVFTSDFAMDFRKKLFTIDYKNWIFFSHDWLIYFFARINGIKIFIDSRPAILYRIHDQNVHGQLNKRSFNAIIRKFQLVNNGWYFKQLNGFSQFIDNTSEEKKIYDQYKKNWYSRIRLLLKYNFQLIRSRKKFFNFLLISILPHSFSEGNSH